MMVSSRLISKGNSGMAYIGRSTMTSKGQITLPADLRERWGLKPGDAVEFFEGYDGAIKVRTRSKAASTLVGLLAHLKPDPAYADDDEAIAEEVRRRDKASKSAPRAKAA